MPVHASHAFHHDALDRAAHLRLQPAEIEALRGHGEARLFILHGDSVLLDMRDPQQPAACFTITEGCALAGTSEALFLGLYDGAPRFALAPSTSAVEAIASHGAVAFQELRWIAARETISARELSVVAAAKSLLGWHARHRFCANCGVESRVAMAGWRRDCPACGAQHFPRTDPVVIMLVSEGERCLLGRQERFLPGMWSCLAGFLEPGEAIEDAVRREVWEEAGIRCGPVHYVASQPWPYPSSLMIGCRTTALTTALTIDRAELEDARWFGRDEVSRMIARAHPDGLIVPHPFAIAHHLLSLWVEGRFS